MKSTSPRYLILFIIICYISPSCVRQFGIRTPSITLKKQKKKLAPPPDFSWDLFAYKKKYGYWPKSEYDFNSFSPDAVKSVFEKGFISWTLGAFSNDTIRIHWIHQPLEEAAASVGIVPISGKKLYMISEHIFSSRTVNKTLVKKKHFQ